MAEVNDLVALTTRLQRTRGYHLAPGFDEAPHIDPWRVAQADFLLPVLVRLAEQVWREDNPGANFGIHIEEDALALTGFRLLGVHHVPAAIVMLAMDEVLRRVADPGGVVRWEQLQAYAQSRS
ncbi:hypothetical protein HLH33_09855 [Gluconacetobacter diazotrophicus]|uniref:Uncharacterized protein n=1 Tax=Gluconacetobacter diazotrophicus TaxID=33996 RepID=A0A7W4FF44_GLUDI|nr:hypothetical protein [Gluconacetobacter diazotrophicus]MBB2156608.1 hypothetical protein [Gluconacetobacter diazotrophicus]